MACPRRGTGRRPAAARHLARSKLCSVAPRLTSMVSSDLTLYFAGIASVTRLSSRVGEADGLPPADRCGDEITTRCLVIGTRQVYSPSLMKQLAVGASRAT